MSNGTVKAFDPEQGSGFITVPDGDDVFVHWSRITTLGFKTLQVGQAVVFELVQGVRGREAHDVVPGALAT